MLYCLFWDIFYYLISWFYYIFYLKFFRKNFSSKNFFDNKCHHFVMTFIYYLNCCRFATRFKFFYEKFISTSLRDDDKIFYRKFLKDIASRWLIIIKSYNDITSLWLITNIYIAIASRWHIIKSYNDITSWWLLFFLLSSYSKCNN